MKIAKWDTPKKNLKKNLKSVYMDVYLPNSSLMWPAKPKELPTPDLNIN